MASTVSVGDGLELSRLGLGCMGMSGTYGAADWDRSVATIHRALDLGVSLLDTAAVYGLGHNEVLVGRAVHDRREQATIATKFGIDRSMGHYQQAFRGQAGYVKASCDASLVRLGVDEIDILYCHRPPEDASIEETVGAMSELVATGKVRHLGVSEFDADQLRRACAVHPIAVMESEYSLWTRDPEALAPVMAELGVGLVAFSPLGRGFLTGTVDRSALSPSDFRAHNTRFVGEAGDANEAIVAGVRRFADDLGLRPAAVALAWVYAQSERLGIPIVTIPGTTRPERVDENLAASALTLPAEALAALAPLGDLVQGERYGVR
ncbi:aldo/keto reductase [Brooklawnia cerclae]|uniref:Aryl-alcohol dehydrogenase-like predicted oxidoreductase n=1 Tax=Brooklawnia cerclae TaxID=349934 RepID=A0ABX0SG64_9ACTN|nr:aldo/keto reductase [Brooklawnia cerclae]NIH56318.1 aryl-alcohol dehydrogenase-like predicted oxidoreductase [Brooklawnia cerclae]